MTDIDVAQIARDIADDMISAARNSGSDPIAWVTGNSYMPPLRSYPQAETVWQSDDNSDGELFAWLTEQVEDYLSDANVALECPEYDNALYVVDLARFEYLPDSDGETLQSEWEPLA